MFVSSIHWCCEAVGGGLDISGNEALMAMTIGVTPLVRVMIRANCVHWWGEDIGERTLVG